MSGNNDPDLIRKIFDSIPALVFVVDDDVSVQEYNEAVAEFLSAERRSIIKHRGGEIFKCVHSTDVPEGCGRAPFCAGCVIRNSVKDAYNGKRIVRTRTRLELIRGENKMEMYALISASPFDYKSKNFILLVIEDISEIAELQRLIPICSVCHNIKDEKKVWLRVETYFKDHWDVDFSHGLCPKCFQKELEKIDH